MPAATILIGALVLPMTAAAFSSIRIAREYETALVSRLGRLVDLGVHASGGDHRRKVSVRVNAVSSTRYSTSGPRVPRVPRVPRAFNFGQASAQIAQTTLRAVLRQSSLNELASIGE
jgi:regulator of protease activity HflC (stomatin/prohibitin superfamily)